jgi:hypothetical protein
LKGRVDVNTNLISQWDIIAGSHRVKRRVKRKIISAESSRRVSRARVTQRTIVVIIVIIPESIIVTSDHIKYITLT